MVLRRWQKGEFTGAESVFEKTGIYADWLTNVVQRYSTTFADSAYERLLGGLLAVDHSITRAAGVYDVSEKLAKFLYSFCHEDLWPGNVSSSRTESDRGSIRTAANKKTDDIFVDTVVRRGIHTVRGIEQLASNVNFEGAAEKQMTVAQQHRQARIDAQQQPGIHHGLTAITQCMDSVSIILERLGRNEAAVSEMVEAFVKTGDIKSAMSTVRAIALRAVDLLVHKIEDSLEYNAPEFVTEVVQSATSDEHEENILRYAGITAYCFLAHVFFFGDQSSWVDAITKYKLSRQLGRVVVNMYTELCLDTEKYLALSNGDKYTYVHFLAFLLAATCLVPHDVIPLDVVWWILEVFNGSTRSSPKFLYSYLYGTIRDNLNEKLYQEFLDEHLSLTTQGRYTVGRGGIHDAECLYHMNNILFIKIDGYNPRDEFNNEWVHDRYADLHIDEEHSRNVRTVKNEQWNHSFV